MKRNKIIGIVLTLSIMANGLYGCGKTKVEPDFSSINSVCELATLECYYHNVAKYEVDANGLFKFMGAGYKKIWIEYSGIVNLGIDMNKLHVSEPDEDNVITIEIPDAEIQSVDLDEDSMSEPYTDKGIFTKITTEEKTETIAKAQEDMKETAEENTQMFAQAKERAKAIIEGYIKNMGNEIGEEYTIKWVDVTK